MEHDHFYTAISKRVTYSAFFTILSALMIITMAMMAILYDQGHETLKSVNAIDKNISGLTQKIDANQENIRVLQRDSRRTN